MYYIYNVDRSWYVLYFGRLKDWTHLSAFKCLILEKFSCFIVQVVFFGIFQTSELIYVWFREKWHFFLNFTSSHIFAIYVGGASLWLPADCTLIAVSGARLPSVDGLVVRCIKMYRHVKPAIAICLQFISNMFTIDMCIQNVHWYLRPLTSYFDGNCIVVNLRRGYTVSVANM